MGGGGEVALRGEFMTKLYQHKLSLMENAENILPEMTTPQIRTYPEMHKNSAAKIEYVEIAVATLATKQHDTSNKGTWVRFNLAPEDALHLAENIIKWVKK